MSDAHLADVVVPGGLQTGPFGSQLKASEYVAVGVPVVMPQDIRGGRIGLDKVARVSEAKAASLHRHRLHVGDILFARRGDLAKIALIGPSQDGWLCGTGCLRVRVDTARVEPRFVLQYLALPRTAHWLQSNALGQTMLNLNTETVGQLPLPLPSLDEQRSIANILATWDSVIEKTERLIRAKLAHRVWVSKSLVDSGVASRRAGSRRRVRFGDVARVGGTKVDPKVEPFRSMLHIGPENVISGTGQIRGLLTAGELKLVSGKHLFDDRSIVYSRIRPYLNKVCFPKFSGLCSSEMYPITVDSQVALPEYITILMLGPSFLSEAIHRTSGTGLPRVSRDDLASIRINLPRSLEGQQQVARWFSGADRELELLEQRIRMLRAQQAAMSARLMSFSATGRGVA